ncbi:Rv3654c family TadE-like protein [Actinomadura scrupuli]|uniref:Rv3654c family TadE-like protein n=1 Tax=Actinomadura scrupuli TaxID=559629 RepID=UPI003D954E83
MSAAHRLSSRRFGGGPVGGDRRTLRSHRGRRHGRRESRRPDEGSGTIWVVGLMALIWLVAITTMVAGGVRAARHRAHAAADGAALAAAAHAAEGPAVACRIAATVAAGTGARLTGCVVRVVPGAGSNRLVQDGYRRRGLSQHGTGPDGLEPGARGGYRRRGLGQHGTGPGAQGGPGPLGLQRNGPRYGGGWLADVSVVATYRGPAWPVTLRIPARARAAPVAVDATGPAPLPPGASSSTSTRNLSSGHSLYTASID